MKNKWMLLITTVLLTLLISVNFFLSDSHSPYLPSESEQANLLKSDAKQRARSQVITQSPNGAGEYFARKRFSKSISQYSSKNIVEAIREKRLYLKANETKRAESWINLGPQDVGGRTRSFIFDPNDSDTIFSAGVSGGIWKSDDAGNNWQAIADDIENLAVVTLALFPETSSTLLAGTGEGVYIGRPIVRSRGVEGNGIYKSVDSGESWAAVDFTLNNPDFQFVNKIRATADNTAFAATGVGIWRSTDFGDNWALVLDQRSRVGGCHEIEIRPATNPNELLVSCGSFETAAVYKSSDNGDSWNVVLAEQNQGRTTLAYAPSDPSIVYALSAQNQFGPYPYGLNGLYRSEDGGDNWNLVADVNSENFNSRSLLSTTNYVFDCYSSGQYQDGRLAGGGWYYNLITVDPTNADRIWTGGLDLWRSDDGGENFSLASFWWAEQDEESYIHGDHHSIVYHPDYDGISENRMFASNDGGIWQTNNPTAGLATNNCDPSSSQVAWNSLNNNYAVTQFYHGSVSRDGQTLIGGAQDNGTIWRAADGNWQVINGGDGSYSAIDPEDSNLVYVSSQYAYLVRINIQPGGNTATEIAGGIDAPGLFITPFTLDPNNNQRLWLAGLALWRSDNRGDTWVKASTDEYTMNYIDGLSAVAVAPGDSNLVLTGGTDGTIYRHTSALSGSSNSNMESVKISDGYISSINFDRNNASRVVATVSTFGEQHAWLSVDAGINWNAIDALGSAGLPDLPTHDILIAPHDSETFYVATDIGVYVSEDSGVSWNPLTDGMPNVAVEKLVYNRFDLQSNLFAFTYGRGTFKSLLTEVINISPHALNANLTANGEENQAFSFELSTSFDDANDDLLTYRGTGLASGLSISSNGTISGTPSAAGIYVATIFASDGELEASTQLSITIAEAPSSSSGGGSLSWFSLILLVWIRSRKIELIANN
ncbi:MAG: putative Ig domain-containing protein [Kangiellaceae bacterium]|nr:putative Ig domain-containing protein [Kangiellaceae bacterium]